MDSEVEGQPPTGSTAARRRVPVRLRRVLQQPFRSVLHQQGLVNSRLTAASEALAESDRRLALEVGRDIGDLAGRLLGELSELQLTVHRLESALERVDHPLGGTGTEVTAGSSDGAGPSLRPAGPTSLPDRAGINLVGDLTATTGLAQAGRRLAVGLRRRGVPVSVTPVRSGAPQMDELFPEELSGLPGGTPYPVDLVTLNVNEVPAVPTADLGRARTGRPAIGAWYWEFETLPPDLVEQVDRIDELWAPTTFVERAFSRCTDIPIHVVPTIVPVFERHAEPALVRRRWGLAPDDVVFLFSFDFNSSVVRKNPFGVVEAYRRAFGTRALGTRLVIKAINLANSPLFEADLRSAVDEVGGVLIDEHLSQDQLGDLFHAADVYVSLHRSEGFGLGLAEAMAIGKAVVGTAYSGNVDFMHVGNSGLVGYRLRPITAEDHRYSAAVGSVYRPGLLVAEPDIDQAARWLQALAADPHLRRRLGTAAAATMAAGYSEDAVVDLALDRLRARWSTTPD